MIDCSFVWNWIGLIDRDGRIANRWS